MYISMKISSSVLALAVTLPSFSLVSCFSSGDADAMFQGLNDAFLHFEAGDMAYYQTSVDDTTPDSSWSGALDLYPAQDVFRRTGNEYVQLLVGWLVNGWLSMTAPPWDWDGWNDDLAWFTLGLIRGYQTTGNFTYLALAMNGSDYVFARGWNTTYNNGGIWELNPEYITNEGGPSKEALSNSPNAQVACLIYQSTRILKYLDRCKTIYDWIYATIFDSTTGAVYNGVNETSYVDLATQPYNQGNFIDAAHLLWLITGDHGYYDAAKLAVDYGFNDLTRNGIFSNDRDYLHGWADDFARGAGNFIHDNGLWDTYYDQFVANANGIIANRRTDLNLTWNAWDEPTPNDDSLIINKYCSAVSWLQYTPSSKPSSNGPDGARTISNQQTGLLIESIGDWQNGEPVALDSSNGGQAQRWLLTSSEEDGSYIIVNLESWLALTADDSGSTSLSQSVSLRHPNQRWFVASQNPGEFSITNKATGLALDGGSGSSLTQTQFTGAASQQWSLQGL